MAKFASDRGLHPLTPACDCPGYSGTVGQSICWMKNDGWKCRGGRGGGEPPGTGIGMDQCLSRRARYISVQPVVPDRLSGV